MTSTYSINFLLVAALVFGMPAVAAAKPNTYPGEHSAFVSDPAETAKREAERAKRKEERKKRREEQRRMRSIKKNDRLN